MFLKLDACVPELNVPITAMKDGEYATVVDTRNSSCRVGDIIVCVAISDIRAINMSRTGVWWSRNLLPSEGPLVRVLPGTKFQAQAFAL